MGRGKTKVQRVFYCACCKIWRSKICSKHPYRQVDDKVVTGKSVHADQTFPDCVQKGMSMIKDAGNGVWATKHIQPNTLFGPYKGTRSEKTPESDFYTWEIPNDDGKKLIFVDGSDPCKSNWLRYVNHSEHPNLMAMKWKANVWYLAVKPILVSTELYVSYGENYGKEIASWREGYPMPKCRFRVATNKRLISSVLQCDLCEKTFTSIIFMERHLSTVHRKRGFKCPQCDNIYPSQSFLDDHTNAVHRKISSYTCDICLHKCSYWRTMFRHLLLHVGLAESVCDVCGAQLFRDKVLHILKHAHPKLLQCTLCHKHYKVRNGLENHFNRYHPDAQKPAILRTPILQKLRVSTYKCTECGKMYGHGSSLHRHMHTKHTQNVKFRCDICANTFFHFSGVSRHLGIHIGLKPYMCRICGAKFGRVDHLKQHMTFHLKQKLYQCDVCGLRMFDKRGVLQHLQWLHTFERPHTCDICCLSVVDKTQLTHHLKRVHANMRGHSCSYCHLSFAALTTKKHHEMSKHTFVKPYACLRCGTCFVKSCGLKLHQQRCKSKQ